MGVAQLVRAPDCGSGGRGFESHHPPHVNFFLDSRPVILVYSVTLGCSQAVRHSTLTAAVAGSNPASPASQILVNHLVWSISSVGRALDF